MPLLPAKATLGGRAASVPGWGSPPLHGRTSLWAGSSIMALLCDLRKLTDPLWATVSLPAERLRGPTTIVDLRKMGSVLREPHTRISLLLRVTSYVRDPLAPPIPQATAQEGSLCPQSVPLAISSYPQGKLWPGDRAWSPEETEKPGVAWGGSGS